MEKVLTTDEIKVLIDNDKTSDKKQFARTGERYYDGDHDINKYRLFYYNADGKLVEDLTRSNVRISHPFFTELVDQCTQYVLSGDRFVVADDQKLQTYMDNYFNNNDSFISELSDCITDSQVKGWAYMYAYKNAKDKMAFAAADALDVIEVREKDADDGCKYTIYHYIERIDKGRKIIKRIQVWDEKETWFYTQVDGGDIQLDESKLNPRPHVLYTQGDKKDATYFDGFGYIPFIRLDNNKKQFSSLKPVKPLIIDGFTRDSWFSLEKYKQKIEQNIERTAILASGAGVAVFYGNASPVPTGDADLKRIQINLTIKEYKNGR